MLFSCKNKTCGGVHWDKGSVKRVLRDNPEGLDQLLLEAGVPDKIKGKKSHFVYTLRLKGEVNAVYVGMTGLHPYARYLNHIRGYKSSKHTKRRATALINFEGPMDAEEAKMREPELAEELREKDYIVYGGH